MRTDKGEEFTSLEFNEYCIKHGIKQHLTTTFTPYQNGVAERKNKTTMNMVRCILYERRIPKTLWPEVVNWTINVLNRSSILVVQNLTPEEAWSDIKPTIEHFRIFGCMVHVHIRNV